MRCIDLQDFEERSWLCSLWAVINMTATACAWQAASEITNAYGWRMFATGSAEAVVTMILGACELKYSYFRAETSDRRDNRVRVKEMILKPAMVSLILGALWQPMVDIGAVMADAIYPNIYLKSALSILTLSSSYGAGLWGLQRFLGLKKPAKTTAILSEVCFFGDNPLPLEKIRGFASGQRDLMWSTILACFGASLGEGILAMLSCYLKRSESGGVADEREQLLRRGTSGKV